MKNPLYRSASIKRTKKTKQKNRTVQPPKTLQRREITSSRGTGVRPTTMSLTFAGHMGEQLKNRKALIGWSHKEASQTSPDCSDFKCKHHTWRGKNLFVYSPTVGQCLWMNDCHSSALLTLRGFTMNWRSSMQDVSLLRVNNLLTLTVTSMC